MGDLCVYVILFNHHRNIFNPSVLLAQVPSFDSSTSQVGDQVRAVYSEDGQEYEGSVVFCNKANKSVTVRSEILSKVALNTDVPTDISATTTRRRWLRGI